jgi:acetyltransferase-like isoleucine patch superfamily enzyme
MLQSAKDWLKAGNSPLSRLLYGFIWHMRNFELPKIAPLNKLLLTIHLSVMGLIQSILRICYWTPMFKASIEGNAKQLYLFGGLPYISGPLRITIGDNSRISGHTTFSGRSTPRADGHKPLLAIGNNVDIGWQSTIAVGTMVKIGNNVRIAGKAFLAGYPGHPVDPVARATGAACDDKQSGDIILEDDVWLATGVSVMAGVRIGKGTIVAAGSVVTRDLPNGVLAAGSPAKVIKTLDI